MAAVSYLLSQQLPERAVGRLGGRVEQRDLQSGSQFVVPHVFGGVLADDLGLGGLAGRLVPPGVVHHRLAESDDTRVEGDLDDFEEVPVRDLTDHVPGGHFAEWQLDPEGLDVGDVV